MSKPIFESREDYAAWEAQQAAARGMLKALKFEQAAEQWENYCGLPYPSEAQQSDIHTARLMKAKAIAAALAAGIVPEE